MAVLRKLSRGKAWRGLAMIGWVLATGVTSTLSAAPRGEISSEFQLKAVFLFRFAQFVEWPNEAFAKNDSPIVIGIAGEDPFGTYLDELVRGERVGPRPLEIRRFPAGAQPSPCHILFVSASENSHLDTLLAELNGRPVLTVSDSDNFARNGGMVRFVLDEGKIRLRINLVAARAGKIVISSKILRASTIVTPGRK